LDLQRVSPNEVIIGLVLSVGRLSVDQSD